MCPVVSGIRYHILDLLIFGRHDNGNHVESVPIRCIPKRREGDGAPHRASFGCLWKAIPRALLNDPFLCGHIEIIEILWLNHGFHTHEHILKDDPRNISLRNSGSSPPKGDLPPSKGRGLRPGRAWWSDGESRESFLLNYVFNKFQPFFWEKR